MPGSMTGIALVTTLGTDGLTNACHRATLSFY